MAVLLAAGQGKRLERVLRGNPKPLLKILGRPLIMHQLSNLEAIGVSEAIIVTRLEYLSEISRVLQHSSRGIRLRIITCETNSGFETFCHARNVAEGHQLLLLVIDSLFRPDDMRRFRARCAELEGKNEFLVGSTPYVHDEKPSYVVTDEHEKVIGIGRNCGNSDFVTAGIYLCPANFCEILDDAIALGINSMSEYLGFYVGEKGPGIQFVFPKMIDVDTPEDITLAEEWLRSNK